MNSPESVSDKIRIEAWRRMNPQEKYDLYRSLMRTVLRLKKAGIASVHPDWTGAQVETELARLTARFMTIEKGTMNCESN